MDFVVIKEREAGTQKKPVLEVYPDFKVVRSKDLMVRGKSFYAIWDEKLGLWVTDEYAVAKLVDEKIHNYETTTTGFLERHDKLMNNFSSHAWLQFRNYLAHLTDHFVQLDENVTFRNSEVKKEDYVSKRLPYDLEDGDISAWNEIVGTLYDEENRKKIEWAIGAIISGDSKTIQKFLVFYGAMGTGKSTIMNIIQWLFEGYFTAFVAKELTAANNAFALEAFKSNPLVAIEHDGDLSKIQDNSKLNSLVSHEWMSINEKNKPIYMMKFIAMLMIGSNNPVKITDGKSGLIRRLIDIHPTGNLISPKRYAALMSQVKFELGAIAHHCLQVYREMGKDYYSGYRPTAMMEQTDYFFNYIEDNHELLSDGITLSRAFTIYKEYIKESGLREEFGMNKFKFREELKNYFEHFEDRGTDKDGNRVRSWYSGFNADRFKAPTGNTEEQRMFSLVMEEKESLFDKRFAKATAQYSKADGSPEKFWDNSQKQNSKGEFYIPRPDQVVSTKLSDLDTTREHYVKVPASHIIIDFDLKDADGKKSAERNLEAASQWPPTYAEFSKSGDGIHLHYDYVGAPEELSNFYADGIEVKVYNGNSSLRRRLSLCNNIEIAKMPVGGLPLKEKKVINEKKIEDEKHLRVLINKALRKEIHPGTKSNVDYIHHILNEAYQGDTTYNVTDMKQKVLNFAMGSTNQAIEAIKKVQTAKWASEDSLMAMEKGQELEDVEAARIPDTFKSEKALNADKLVIFDVEVFPNLFVICWKYQHAPRESIVEMINPSAADVKKLMGMKLVGFNVKRYDNHILYAASLGYSVEELYKLSYDMINHGARGFGEAWNISYTDIWDFATDKRGLKKWQIELGLDHDELGLPWDKPVPRELWRRVAQYCANDVDSTDKVLDHLEQDYIARQILSDLSGLSMNASTNQHTTRIVFGDVRDPQSEFKYTNLADHFPGYKFEYDETAKKMQSTYREEITGEGGYVYAEPGMYENVAVLDIASMHPSSIEALDLFGKYTEKFAELKAARVAIKRKDYDTARTLMDGKLARYLTDSASAKKLSNALKLPINSVYGMTSASFANSFRDPRNIDNIVAKRGALFMVDLKNAVQEQGFPVVHIKTDSIKIPNATPEIIQFVMDFGKKYGYEFEHEHTYSKMCLVNDAVYIAQIGWSPDEEEIGKWSATGKQFAEPYVYKYLFSKEAITTRDMSQVREVKQGAVYLDFTSVEDVPMAFADKLNEDKLWFVGKTGRFYPMNPGFGGNLVRVKDDKHFAVSGTKGFYWMEADMVEKLGLEKEIDGAYYENLINEAIETIKKFGDYEWFVSNDMALAA